MSSVPGIFPGRQRRQVRRADNLTNFMCRLSWNLGASTSRKSPGLYRDSSSLQVSVHSADWDSRLFWNVGTYLPNYRAPNPQDSNGNCIISFCNFLSL